MKNRYKKFLVILLVFVIIVNVIEKISEIGDYYIVDYEKKDINEILLEGIDEEEYITLKEQTGLGKEAVKEILKKDDAISILNNFQQQNFAQYNVECEYMFFPVTKGESLKDNTGSEVKLNIPEIKNGDIFFTQSTHTLFFRHGHVGLVTNADSSEVLEAMMLGTNSMYNRVSAWRNYPTLAILRPKNLSEEEIKAVIDYAKENLFDIEYSLTAGIFDDDENPHEISSTHCSHLVWHAYMSAGINIDSNRGRIVLPEDFLKSDELEIVWSYGINATK